MADSAFEELLLEDALSLDISSRASLARLALEPLPPSDLLLTGSCVGKGIVVLMIMAAALEEDELQVDETLWRGETLGDLLPAMLGAVAPLAPETEDLGELLFPLYLC